MNLSPTEVMVILVVALLAFGPHRLPDLARQVGGVMRELRQIQNTVKGELKQAMKEETASPSARPPQPVSEPVAATDEEPVAATGEEPDHTDIGPLPGYEPPAPSHDPESGGSFS